MRIAIPYQQDRVSPVFDVATHILLLDIDKSREVKRNKRTLAQTTLLARAQDISQFGVEVLICGAISWPLENALSSKGIQVIAYICGPIEAVVKAFMANQLTQNAFIMPGCLDWQQRLPPKKEDTMEKPTVNYETLIRISKAISTIQNPEEIVLITVEGVTHALNVKGCALFLIGKKNDELGLAGYYGLSDEFVDKGPISGMRSIALSLQDRQPVAIYDVSDDPRIQYPEATLKEGIASILSAPIIIGEKVIGCMRVYTAEPWEFTLCDVNFVEAVAQIVGMAIEMCRANEGLRESIDILEMMQDPRTLRDRRRTPYEGVPQSFTRNEMTQSAA